MKPAPSTTVEPVPNVVDSKNKTGGFADAPKRPSLGGAGNHCPAFAFCHAGPQWGDDQSGRESVHSNRGQFEGEAARERMSSCSIEKPELRSRI